MTGPQHPSAPTADGTAVLETQRYVQTGQNAPTHPSGLFTSWTDTGLLARQDRDLDHEQLRRDVALKELRPIDNDVDRIRRCALAKDPRHRFVDAKAFAAAIRAAVLHPATPSPAQNTDSM